MTPSVYDPLVDAAMKTVATLAATAITAIIARVGAAVKAYFDAHANGVQQSVYNNALEKSVSIGINEAATAISQWGAQHPNAQRVILDEAGAALLSRFPQTCAAVGVKTREDARQALLRVMAAALPAAPDPAETAQSVLPLGTPIRHPVTIQKGA